MEDNKKSAASGGFIISISSDGIEALKKDCFEGHQNSSENFFEKNKILYCPWTFDGWACWNDTPANSVAFTQCPEFVVGFDPERRGHKVCTENGTWDTHPANNAPWSNYTNCVSQADLENFLTVNLFYIVGYSISLVALAISLGIFMNFRSLQCKRVTIHKNLFASFLINNALWLIWHLCVAEENDVVAGNGLGCQFLHILLHYFLVSNYFWMFCEGLYLHTLLVVTFLKTDKIINWFLTIGWGLPFFLMSVYTTCRALNPSYNNMCWNEDSPYNYLLSVPVVLSMMVNLVFLFNIVRVLLTKLRAPNGPHDSHSARKAVRATFILIPLLGLHYILTPFRPSKGSYLEYYYLITSAITSSFQGFAVSMLFCFFNGEVVATFVKKWSQRRILRHSPQLLTATTVTFVKNNTMIDAVTITSNYGAVENLNSDAV